MLILSIDTQKYFLIILNYFRCSPFGHQSIAPHPLYYFLERRGPKGMFQQLSKLTLTCLDYPSVT